MGYPVFDVWLFAIRSKSPAHSCRANGNPRRLAKSPRVIFCRRAQLSRMISLAGQKCRTSLAISLILPEIPEPVGRQRSVAHGRGNRPMPKIMLDRAGVLPIVGELVARRVAEHVAMG